MAKNSNKNISYNGLQRVTTNNTLKTDSVSKMSKNKNIIQKKCQKILIKTLVTTGYNGLQRITP